VANYVPVYLPVVVPSSLVSIFIELFVISSMRLSVTLDLIVRLCRAAGYNRYTSGMYPNCIKLICKD
jgi:hypothetical protein